MPPKLWLLLVADLITATYCSQQSQSPHEYIDLAKKPHFVDKSRLLTIIFQNDSYPHTYFTSPRRFGRTANLDMIDLFANVELDSSFQPINYTQTKSYEIFNRSELGRRQYFRYIIDLHLAQHPVVYVNLGASLPKNFGVRSMFKYLLNAVQKAYKRYEWLLNLPPSRLNCGPDRVISKEDIAFVHKLLNGRVNQAGVEDSLKTLSRILYKYFDRKVIILVDSLDHALSHALFYSKIELLNDTETFDALNVLDRMVANAVRFLPYTVSFMTGLSHAAIDKEHLGSVAHYNFLEYHKFVGYFGYTEEEVDRLLVKNRCTMPERNAVVSYYNGHRIVDGETKLFSPNCITRYLQHRVKDSEFYHAGLKPYFFGSEKIAAILKFLPIPVFRHNLISLVNRMAIKFVPIINFEQVHFDHYFLLRNNNFTVAVGYRESFAQSLLLTMVLKMGYLCYTRDREFVLPSTEMESYLDDALNTFYAPENGTFYEIGALFYTVIGAADDENQRETRVRDLRSKLSDLFARLSTIYDYTRIFELEYRFVTYKSIKKYQKDSGDKGNVWTSGKELEAFLVTSRANNRTAAGVIQISCSNSAVDSLGKIIKNIRPKVSRAPITYFGISVDQQLNVDIETSVIDG